MRVLVRIVGHAARRRFARRLLVSRYAFRGAWGKASRRCGVPPRVAATPTDALTGGEHTRSWLESRQFHEKIGARYLI